jgi:hypothetical protein
VIHACSKVLVPVFTVSPAGQEPLLLLLLLDEDDEEPLLLVLAVPGRAQAIKSILPRANTASSSATVRKCFLTIIRNPLNDIV